MTFYLMVKTHNITGLKYLCQTSRKDPHTYLGSGLYWRRHLKIYGNDIKTEIVMELKSKEDVTKWGIYYSRLWDVVLNDAWTNMKEENGDGGAMSLESSLKATSTKIKNGTLPNNPEIIAKSLSTKMKNGTLMPTPETVKKIHEKRRQNKTTSAEPNIKAKCLDTKIKNGTLNSNSVESIEKAKHTRQENNTTLANPEVLEKARLTKTHNNTLPSNENVILKGLASKLKNGTTPDNPEIQNKIKETKRLRGTSNDSPEIIAKRESSLKERGTGNYEKITCIHCNKTLGKPSFIQHHGDKCKFKDVNLLDTV